MRIQQGEATITDPGLRQEKRSASVFKCCHCGGYVHTKTLRSHDFSTCMNCEDGTGRGLRCNKPECQVCSPFMRRLEEEEAKERLRVVG